MFSFKLIYLITFILALCSIIYELLLAQSLSAFLGNTVLRYSITIGLYMFAMGIGSMYAGPNVVKRPVLTLLKVEIGMILLGGLSVIILFLLNFIGLAGALFIIPAHVLIILIGLLTGMEIPLLIEIKNKDGGESENKILGVDYLGAFAGTILFAFILYPRVGLVETAFIIALINSVAGFLLLAEGRHVVEGNKAQYNTFVSLNILLGSIMFSLILNSETISEMLITTYLEI